MFSNIKTTPQAGPAVGKPLKEVLTGRELMALLNISRTTLWKLRKEENLPYAKVGKKYLYLRSEILSWLKTQRGKKKRQLLIPLHTPPNRGSPT